MSVVAVIPTRLASTRFPRKALADRTGYPLVVHACMQAAKARTVDRVLVAADGEEIQAAVEAHGYDCTLTDPNHPNGTSRINEALRDVACDYVVNVQGDEPELDPAHIDQAVECLRNHDECVVATLATPFESEQDPADPNLVKVMIDEHGRADGFSRIPPADGQAHRHIGLYVYRRPFLPVYVDLPPTESELQERLEQLRILGHGHRIAVGLVPSGHEGIDTPGQYDDFVARWMESNRKS